MLKCALLGCGSRSRGHAEAYRKTDRGKLIAACSDDPAKLTPFCDQYDIRQRYANLADMLETERPDVLHVVTDPDSRVEVLTCASDLGVPLVIVEKPIGVQGEDYLELRKLAAATRAKICVNHQLHFHPRRLALQQHVEEGGIGEVRFIDASARLNLAGQGTHVLELIDAFNGFARTESVFAQIAGGKGLDAVNGHRAPDQCVAAIAYANGVRAQFQCGANAPVVAGNAHEHLHKRIAVYGTHGFVHWTMHGWEMTTTAGIIQRGEHAYADEDLLGQTGLTDAAFDWLEDDSKVHPLNLAASLDEFATILATFTSAIEHRPVDLPFDPPRNLIEKMRQCTT